MRGRAPLPGSEQLLPLDAVAGLDAEEALRPGLVHLLVEARHRRADARLLHRAGRGGHGEVEELDLLAELLGKIGGLVDRAVLVRAEDVDDLRGGGRLEQRLRRDRRDVARRDGGHLVLGREKKFGKMPWLLAAEEHGQQVLRRSTSPPRTNDREHAPVFLKRPTPRRRGARRSAPCRTPSRRPTRTEGRHAGRRSRRRRGPRRAPGDPGSRARPASRSAAARQQENAPSAPRKRRA